MDLMNYVYTRLFPIKEGNIFKKKKKKKKKCFETQFPAPPPPPPTDAIEAVYRSQLNNYSIDINALKKNIRDLREQVAKDNVIIQYDKEECARKLTAQKTKYVNEEKQYQEEINNLNKEYQQQINELEAKLNRAKNTISLDENTIREKNKKINQVTNELNKCRRLRTNCILEARAAANRLGNSRAGIEASIYKKEMDDYILQIEQNIETMKNQCLYAYTLRDHIKSVEKNIKKVDEQIEEYIDKVNLDKRKSTYEQDVINMEEGWEIGLHIVYAAIFLGIIVYLSINLDKSTKTLKIMQPNNIAILVFLLLYPMIIYPMTKYIYNGIQYGINQLPKNMYMDL